MKKKCISSSDASFRFTSNNIPVLEMASSILSPIFLDIEPFDTVDPFDRVDP